MAGHAKRGPLPLHGPAFSSARLGVVTPLNLFRLLKQRGKLCALGEPCSIVRHGRSSRSTRDKARAKSFAI